MKIAVVGGGIAGVAAAWKLSQAGHEVTLFEAQTRLGGHTHTVTISSGPDAGVRVDAGFITFNRRTYPLFSRWLEELGVASRESDMSFGYTCRLSGLAYAGQNLDTWFARRRQLVHPDFLRMTVDVLRFNARARRNPDAPGTLGEYVTPYGGTFLRHYLLPLGASIWSAPYAEMLAFPASTFLRFFENHGLLSVLDRPAWRTVVNGSQSYLEVFQARFRGRLLLNAGVERARRTPRPAVRQGGEWLEFDQLVLACHADQALALLEDPSPEEAEALGAWRYQANRAVVHIDASLVTAHPRVRAAWNYVRTRVDGPATLTYDMNLLQGLSTSSPYFVSLNPVQEPRGVVTDIAFRHPLYTSAAVRAQETLRGVNGQRGTWYAGSYRGFGFHEDAFRSAQEIAV